MAYKNVVVIRLILASCEILHAVNRQILIKTNVGIGVEYRGHGLPRQQLQPMGDRADSAVEVIRKSALAESIAVMEQEILKVNVGPLRIVIECENPFRKGPLAGFALEPLYRSPGGGMIVATLYEPVVLHLRVLTMLGAVLVWTKWWHGLSFLRKDPPILLPEASDCFTAATPLSSLLKRLPGSGKCSTIPKDPNSLSPEVSMSEVKRLSCSDGKILVYRSWIPENLNVRAVLLIYHGMAEHSRRYDRFATYLNTLGIAVYAQDHRGHGMTASDDELGWFADKDGWFRVVQDGYELSLAIKENHPGKDLFLLGHSMGSFLARTTIVLHPALYQGVIISGTSASKGLLGKVGRMIATSHARRKGGKEPDALMDKLSFGAFSKPFQPQQTNFDWLSRDTNEVRAYIDDPLCGFMCSSQFFVDLLDGIAFANNPEEIAKIPKTLPLLFISGGMDPVGDFGKGVNKAAGLYKAAGIEDLTVEIIPDARHELLNETNRDEIQVLLALWLEKHISKQNR